jgi:hypothetical protein
MFSRGGTCQLFETLLAFGEMLSGAHVKIIYSIKKNALIRIMDRKLD